MDRCWIMKLSEKKLIVLSISLIILIGVFLRFYNISEIYTEYDDIGVVSLHKGQASEIKEVTLLSNSILDLDIKVKQEGIKNNLLDSALFPFYIGHAWTYPIGQYIAYPLLINENDSYDEKLTKGRSVSAFFSTISIILLAYLLYLVNKKKWSWLFLLPISILAFSFNSVLYAHHMSPYSVSATCIIISLIFFVKLLNNEISTTRFFFVLSILTIFSYLTLLTIPIFGVLTILHKKLFNFKSIFVEFYKGTFIFLFTITPILTLFFKSNAGMHGTLPPSIQEGILNYFVYLLVQLAKTGSSIFAFFTTNQPINILLISLVFIFSTVLIIQKIIRDKLGLEPLDYLIAFSLVFFMEWVILHAINKIVMDQSRHVLMWAPIFSLLVFYILVKIKSKYLSKYFLIFLGLIISIISIHSNIKIMVSKTTNFDYTLLKQSPEINTILTFSYTLSPLVYYQDSMQVYNIDFNSFHRNYAKLNLPNKMYLISQESTINEYKKTNLYKLNSSLFNDYKIEPIFEKKSTTLFSFNNNPVSSNPNGYYLYILSKN